MKKNNFYILLLVSLLIFTSCSTKDCSKIVYKDGVSTLNGRLYTGDCESWHPNGQLKSSQHYVDGKDDGNWVFYFIDGTVQTKAVFKKGIRVGKWEYYYENGGLWKESYYDDGEKSGTWKTFLEDGLLIEEDVFKKN
ncbi:hypothetical protein N9848_01680 [Flavobacteriaceae bacterium]|nr:hypothetical protein [Flavobacteriaceae bacterium]MDB4255336.1 hypothetical protein [Flavobacteriaceae bacterium]|tara:strand:- start:3727 stop:4137 length:411 start_codon:yes stop_codon:yes gene_type:complete